VVAAFPPDGPTVGSTIQRIIFCYGPIAIQLSCIIVGFKKSPPVGRTP
jgi:hypothetical protein